MWKWLRKLICGENECPPVLPLKVGERSDSLIADGPTRCSLERLDREQALIIDTRGKVRGTDQMVEVRLTVSDEHTLRELSGLLINAMQRLEPPYFSETDMGPLWEDEHPDIYEDVRNVLGDWADEWLHTVNIHFGLKTPAQIIALGKAFWVREILRRIKLGGFS